MSTAAPAPRPITLDEYARLPDPGYPTELVRGRIVRLSRPKPYHGVVCGNVYFALSEYVRAHALGYVMTNDSGVITERDPDTLRGPDVCFYSYAKVPKGSLRPDQWLDVPPDLAIEVLSPDDRWPKVLVKVGEYLEAGVAVVGVLDSARRTLHLYEGDRPVRILAEEDELTLPALLGDFRVEVARFFD